MNIQTKAQSTELVVLELLTPAVLFGPGGVDDILGKIEREVRAVRTDISTEEGRAEIASLAYKVARSKTALDAMGKDLVADLKAKTGAIDAERRRIRERLDELKEDIRRPLTEWENAEKARVDTHEQKIAAIGVLQDFGFDEPRVDEIDRRIAFIEELAARDWQEFSARAKETREIVITRLRDRRQQTVKRAEERAELERLQRAELERQQKERDERIAAEAAEKARLAAEAKATREAWEAEQKAEAERKSLELAMEAAERARIIAEADARKQIEQAELMAARAAEEAAREKAAAAQRARQAEADRIAAAEQAERDKQAAIEAERRRVAEVEAAERAAQEKRERNKRHLAKINGEARDAIVRLNVTVELATELVRAIAKGEIPHVHIDY